MRFVPRRYEPSVIEAMALAGALDPALDGEGRAAAATRVAQRLGAEDSEAQWSARVGEGARGEYSGWMLRAELAWRQGQNSRWSRLLAAICRECWVQGSHPCS